MIDVKWMKKFARLRPHREWMETPFCIRLSKWHDPLKYLDCVTNGISIIAAVTDNPSYQALQNQKNDNFIRDLLTKEPVQPKTMSHWFLKEICGEYDDRENAAKMFGKFFDLRVIAQALEYLPDTGPVTIGLLPKIDNPNGDVISVSTMAWKVVFMTLMGTINFYYDLWPSLECHADEERFILGIRGSMDREVAVMAYSDWLEEHGQVERALSLR